jgi:hypothetical protein
MNPDPQPDPDRPPVVLPVRFASFLFVTVAKAATLHKVLIFVSSRRILCRTASAYAILQLYGWLC